MRITNDAPILKTTQYGRFKLMAGNRTIDRNHVARLKKLMAVNGNLTTQVPILVDEDMQILDGQHRLTALKELNWEVHYQVRHMDLQSVRSINVGNKNWSWYDFAQSYARLGDKNYQRFVKLADTFPNKGFGVLAAFAGIRDRRTATSGSGLAFRKGDLAFTAEQYDSARAKMLQWEEIAECLDETNGIMAQAFANILRDPSYDHAWMLDKAKKHGVSVFSRYQHSKGITEYMRAFEELYNFNRKDGLETRLY